MFFCGVPSEYNGMAQGHLCKWPAGHEISIFVRDLLPGVNPDDQYLAHRAAWQAWAAAANVRHTFVGPDQFANVRILASDLGGPRGVLARATLPCGGVDSRTQLFQEYDNTEAWSVGPESVTGKIDLLAVIVHETGHTLGLPHGPVGNIMAANYTGSRAMGDWDRVESVKRYGEPEPRGGDLTLRDVLQSARQFLDDLLKNG